jgi:hypothetical protein
LAQLADCVRAAGSRIAQAAARLESLRDDRDALEAQARDLAFAFAQGAALSLQTRHTDWALRHENDGAHVAAAQCFAQSIVG